MGAWNVPGGSYGRPQNRFFKRFETSEFIKELKNQKFDESHNFQNFGEKVPFRPRGAGGVIFFWLR